jgi:hypothetical protein
MHTYINNTMHLFTIRRVYGAVRSAKSVKALEAAGIFPLLVPDFADVATYAEHLKAATVVVDASIDYANPHRIPKAVVEHLEAAASATTGDRQLFVYCSGILTSGTSLPGQVADERGKYAGPGIPWRAAAEAIVLGVAGKNRVARTVLRPGFVYGGSGGGFGPKWFEDKLIEGDANRKYTHGNSNNLIFFLCSSCFIFIFIFFPFHAG